MYAFIGAVWLVLIGRVIPDLHRDHSVFVSIAERLIAGDRLYSGAWDNKDPLFYWILAMGRYVSPYADVVIEILWLLLACFSVRSMMTHLSFAKRVTTAFAFGVTPIILTGGMYVPGLTHLPAEALILASTALALKNKYLIAGLVLSTLAMEKLILTPVAVIAVAVVLHFGEQSQSLRKLIRDFGFGIFGGLAFWMFVLFYRHELGPYFYAQKLNFLYANSGAGRHALSDALGPIFRHYLQTVSTSTIIIVPLLIGYLIITKFDPRKRFTTKTLTATQNLLWYLALSTFIMSTAILFVAGIWTHHAQIYYVPAVFAGLLFTSRLFGNIEKISAKEIAILTVLALLLGGVVYPNQYLQSSRTAVEQIKSLGKISPLTQELLTRGQSGTYARAGSNGDLGHAYGLRSWHLACARFNQYSFDPPQLLKKDTNCLSKAKYILVTPGVYEKPEPDAQNATTSTNQDFNNFVTDFRALLATSYTCKKYTYPAEPTATGYICEKRTP